MDNLAIKIGLLFREEDTKKEYRIVGIDDGEVALCLVKQNEKYINTRLELSYASIASVRTSFNSKEFTLVQEQMIDFDESLLSTEDAEKYKTYKHIVSLVTRQYGPLYKNLTGKQKKPELDRIIADSGLTRAGVWKVIIRYFQSGFKDVALLSNYRKITSEKGKRDYTKKTGRPPRTKYDLDGNPLPAQGIILTKDDYAIFDKYCRRYLSSEVNTITAVYNDMISEAYSREIETEDGYIHQELPFDQQPTEWQFYNYLRNKITPEQKAIAKNKAAVVKNNQRAFTGSVMSGVKGPGDMVEIDAHESDVSMVSQEFPDICIGRPIIYLMIDVFTRLILAVSVALDNNSVVGLTNCFFNLVEDKEELYRKYAGTTFSFKEGMSMNDVWPSNFKPAHLRYDHGSDFISDEITRIMNELNIVGDMVPPASGSMKPVVERIFGDIETNLKDILEHKGLIRKVYGSKHHKEACIDINDAIKVILDYVLYHNTDALRQYKRSADMKKNGVLPIPCMLWKYGIQNLINPEYIADRDSFIFKIMTPLSDKKATISRQGIEYRDLKYFNQEDLHDIMFRLQNKKEEFQCRIDPRDCGHIYYLHNGLKAAYIDQRDPIMRSYAGMSWKHYDELSKDDVSMADTMNIHHNQNQRQFRKRVKTTVNAAYSEKTGPANTKNLRQNRLEEKSRISSSLSVANRFGIQPEAQIPDNHDDDALPVKTNVAGNTKDPIPQGFEDIEKRMKENARKRLMLDDDED